MNLAVITIVGVEFPFPGATTGLVFAIVETFGGFVNFAAAPLIERVEEYGLDPLYYTMIAVAAGLLLVNFIQLPIAFKRGPSCLLQLDNARSKAKEDMTKVLEADNVNPEL